MRTLLRTSVLLVGGAVAATAQLPNASPVATGVGGAYTARARGYDAVAWNPANLGMPNNPGFALSANRLERQILREPAPTAFVNDASRGANLGVGE